MHEVQMILLYLSEHHIKSYVDTYDDVYTYMNIYDHICLYVL